MTAAMYDFYYATSEMDAARAGGRTAISREANLRMSEQRMRTLTHPAPAPPEWAQDLWDVVIGAYLSDRLAPRKKADDRWTRHISLALPVTDVSRWTDECQTLLADLLQTATGDRWHLEFRQWRRTRTIDDTDLYRDDATTHADQVALFSGGLDSTAYAATAAREGVNAILVSFSLQKLAAFQNEIYSDIARLGSGPRLRTVDKLPMEVNPLKGRKRRSLEPSSRSRGLLFIATAVYLAAAYRAPRAVVPENGQLAINPPLSPARMASCSTRSVHPWVLEQINRLIRLLGGSVEVVNPLLSLTKGDVCGLAQEAGLSAKALFDTISCGHPPFLYDDPLPLHCGLCVACLLRRSGLHTALGYDNTRYEFADLRSAPTKRLLNVAALARWSTTPYGMRDLLGDQPLPPDSDFIPLLEVLERGRSEISLWLASLVGDRIAGATAA
jgi:7-cyano-7-deazaguanine synthase in queuosine biosynthesis